MKHNFEIFFSSSLVSTSRIVQEVRYLRLARNYCVSIKYFWYVVNNSNDLDKIKGKEIAIENFISKFKDIFLNCSKISTVIIVC